MTDLYIGPDKTPLAEIEARRIGLSLAALATDERIKADLVAAVRELHAKADAVERNFRLWERAPSDQAAAGIVGASLRQLRATLRRYTEGPQ